MSRRATLVCAGTAAAAGAGFTALGIAGAAHDMAWQWLVFPAAAIATVAGYLGGDRLAAALAAADRSEQQALESRRELYRMKRDASRPLRADAAARGPDGEPSPQARRGPDFSTVARATHAITEALHEDRVVDVLAVAIVDALGAGRAIVALHDRRVDRLLAARQAAIREGLASAAATTLREAEERLARQAMRTRRPVERGDVAAKAVFDGVEGDVIVALPLFDRALAAGAVLIAGELDPESLAAAEVLAATASLALSNARLRVGGAGIESAPVPDDGASVHA
jgi:hypothetical protein